MQLKQIFSFKRLVLAFLILALLGTAINVSMVSDDSNVIASVGKEKIMIDDFIAEYKKHERYFQSMFNFGLTDAQLREMGIGRMVLTNLIQERIIAQLFERMGLHIDASLAINRVKKDPAFQEEGRFSRARLEDFLARNDLTEHEYLKRVKRDIGKALVFGTFFNTQGKYERLAELFYNSEYRVREVSVARITGSELPAISVPTESELISFYEQNKEKFFSEEHRAAQYVTISEDTVKEELVMLPEEDVQKVFDELQLEKRYYISYMAFDSHDEAEKMKKSVSSHPEFYANDLTSVEGAVKSDLPLFLPKDVKWDGNKWFLTKYMGKFYIYTVVKIVAVSKEERLKNFEELRKFMRLNRLGQVIENIREEIASGAELEVIEGKYGTKVEYVPLISKFSLSKEGKKITMDKALLDEIFASEKDVIGEVVMPRKLLIFKVVSIEPIAEQPFKKIRGRVVKAFSREKRMQLASDLLKKRQQTGKNTEKVALHRLEIAKRKKSDYPYSSEFIEEIYKLNIGDTTKLFESGDGFFLGRVLGDKDPQPDGSVVAEIEAKIREEIGFSLLSELTQAAMKEFKVKVNTDLVKELL